MPPQITTIICTYRRPHLLARAIQSVLNQTYPDFQVCVFDNASGDETGAVVNAFARRDPRVRYFCHAENIGMLGNFECAMRSVNTPFYSVLNDDDIVLPGFFEAAQATYARYPDILFASGLTFDVTEEGRARIDTPFNLPAGYHPAGEGLKTLLQHGYPLITGVLFRESFREKVGLFDASMGIAADVDLFYRAGAHHAFAVFHTPSALVLVHTGSASGSGHYRDTYLAFPRIAAKLEADNDLPEVLRREASAEVAADLLRRLKVRALYCLVTQQYAELQEILVILRTEMKLGRTAKLLGLCALVSEHVPGVHGLISLAHGAVKRKRGSRTARLEAGLAGARLDYGDYLRQLDAEAAPVLTDAGDALKKNV